MASLARLSLAKRIAGKVGSLLLGVFVVWQLVYIPTASTLQFLPALKTSLEKRPWAKDAASWVPDPQDAGSNRINSLQMACDRYWEASNQPQIWSLFAPNIARDVWFVAVELRWDDPAQEIPSADRFSPPVKLLSENEPADVQAFFRVGHFRIRRYEMAIEVELERKPAWTEAERLNHWRDTIRHKVAKYWDNMRSYLRYRSQYFAWQHPEAPPPRQVMLYVRHYPIPPLEMFHFNGRCLRRLM